MLLVAGLLQAGDRSSAQGTSAPGDRGVDAWKATFAPPGTARREGSAAAVVLARLLGPGDSSASCATAFPESRGWFGTGACMRPGAATSLCAN
jgi:hypothetical protein